MSSKAILIKRLQLTNLLNLMLLSDTEDEISSLEKFIQFVKLAHYHTFSIPRGFLLKILLKIDNQPVTIYKCEEIR